MKARASSIIPENRQDDLHLAKILTCCVLATAIVFSTLGAYRRSGADPAFSRLATVYSLVHDGTFFIDRPADSQPLRFEQNTIDKVMVRGERVGAGVKNGRLISSKPPILPLLMAAEYVAMKKVFGWTLDSKEDTNKILLWMTITLVGGAYVLSLYLFVKILNLLALDEAQKILLLLCLAFCTQMWGYSTLFNNHVPGACALIGAIYAGISILTDRNRTTIPRFLFLGFCTSLVFALDMPATIFAAAVFLFVFWNYKRETLIWALLGGLPVLIVHFAIEFYLTNSFLPVQSHKNLYWFESSYWRNPIQVDALNEPKLTYLFHMTFGRSGIFSLYPVLLLGVAGGIRALYRTNIRCRYGILAGFFSFLVMSVYYLLKTNNYGGEAYGFRWYIPAMPVLLLMGIPVLRSFNKKWHWVFFAFLAALSFYSAWEATKVGWSANQEWTCRFLGKSY